MASPAPAGSTRKTRYVSISEDIFAPLMGNVTCGQFFMYGGNLCIRISKNTSGQWEAYDFETKEKIGVPFTDRVRMVDCKVRYSYIREPAN